MPKGKGYLDFTGSSVKPASVFLDDEDDPTGINEIVNGKSLNGNCYNLAGQMVNGKSVNGKLPKGIYIVGKTKVLK